MIHCSDGKARETRRLTWLTMAVPAVVVTISALIQAGLGGVELSAAAGRIGLILLLIGAMIEIRVLWLHAQTGKPVIDFGDRAIFYWRKKKEPPEEIPYAEILAHYATLLGSGGGTEEAFVTIEFNKRRAIRLRSSHLDIGPRQLLAVVELKLDHRNT